MSFPENFIWGASTSAYQIEGAWEAEGKGLSTWDMFTRSGSHIWEGHSGREACDHFHRYKEDVALLKQMGVRAYRFSVAWTRILPGGTGKLSKRGLDFYDRLVDELLAAGIQPWVTLFHWDYPYELFLKGGWLNPDSPRWFGDYTELVVKRLSDRVADWITQSDPQCFIGLGYMTGEHAPGLKLEFPEVLLAAHHALMAHGLSVQAIRAVAKKKPRVGWSTSATVFYPSSPSREDVEAARRATLAVHPGSLWNNTWWGDPIIFGRYPEDGLRIYGQAAPKVRAGDMEMICQPLDFLGCNIFQGVPVKAGPDGSAVPVPFPPGHPQTLYLWKQTPEVIYWCSRYLNAHYKTPIVITENGISSSDFLSLDGRVHDHNRVDFLNRHLLELHRAIQDGVDVRGFFYWSLMDNFEWQDGFKHRFGLIYVDFPTQRRTLKESAHWYRDVIASNGRELEKYLPVGTVQPPYLVKETIRYVHSHVHESFNIQDLAAHLRCHPDYLGRKFKGHTGVDLSLYIRRVRIDRARELLRDPKKSIDSVAEETGFSDRIYFAKVFRGITGQTPGQYRKQFKATTGQAAVPAVSLRPVNPRSAPD